MTTISDSMAEFDRTRQEFHKQFVGKCFASEAVEKDWMYFYEILGTRGDYLSCLQYSILTNGAAQYWSLSMSHAIVQPNKSWRECSRDDIQTACANSIEARRQKKD